MKKKILILLLLCSYNYYAAPQRHPAYEAPIPATRQKGDTNNLFLHAKITATSSAKKHSVQQLVNGIIQKNDYWQSATPTAKIEINLQTPKTIQHIILHTINRRIPYQFIIQTSLNRKKWQTVANYKNNKIAAQNGKYTVDFATQKTKYIKIIFTGNRKTTAVSEIEAYDNKPINNHLQGAVVSIDKRYYRNSFPTTQTSKHWHITAWQGERVYAQLLLWSEKPQKQLHLKIIDFSPNATKANFIRYTSGKHGAQPDIIDDIKMLDLAAGTARPVWVTIDIPANIPPGKYNSTVIARAVNNEQLSFSLVVEVLPLKMPPPSQWKFHLDLWQNPFAVAQYHHVKLWSKEHFALMRPLYEMLANAGQKCITASLLYQPWGGQTYTPFGSLIDWRLGKDGNWQYDFSVFDKYIKFCDSCGITERINCYSMIPWSNKFRYFDEAKDQYVTISASPGSKAYNEHWRPFLKAFSKHLQKMGWLQRTAVAMDERPEKLMNKLMAFLHEVAPEIKVASAVNYFTKVTSEFSDVSMSIKHIHGIKPETLKNRHNKGQQTTFYVCCNPAKPNTFTHSPPVEAAWLGIYASAKNLDGFLRWAYNSWVEEPLLNTSHTTWTAGDCFLVYPGPRSSLRFERLREGIQNYEKIAILRKMAARSNSLPTQNALKQLDTFLDTVTFAYTQKHPIAEQVKQIKKLIEELSRTLCK